MKNTNPPAAYTAEQISDWFCAWNANPENNWVASGDYSLHWPMLKDRLFFLMYVAQGHYLATFGQPLFDDTLLATKYGPVVDTIHYLTKRRAVIEVSSDFKVMDFRASDHLFLSCIWDAYRSWTGVMIADMRNEAPFAGMPKKRVQELTHEAIAYSFHPSKPVHHLYAYLDDKAIAGFHDALAKENADYLANAR